MNILDPKKTNKLSLVRKGWFGPTYELTDNAYLYGTMKYSGLSRRSAVIATATGKWLFEWIGPFSRTIILSDEHGTEIGKAVRGWFTHTVTLTMNSGFKAELRKAGIFSREYIWIADGCGKVMEIRSRPFSFTDTVTISSSMAPQAILPLLIFLGEHLIILRRRRRAAR